MSVRPWLSCAAVVAGLVCAPALRAEKLSKEDKNWLKQVEPIMLDDEERTFKDLQEKDRQEFEKIFWARRATDPRTPDRSEFRQAYDKARAEADQRFRVQTRLGSATDCGRVLILLGEPNEVRLSEDRAPELGRRAPEIWTYLDRGQIKFTGGRLELPFDGDCQLPSGSGFHQQLARLAEAKILHPNLAYKLDSKGRLLPLSELLPKPTPARKLLAEPRADFPLKAEATMVLRSPDGSAYLAGLIQGQGADLAARDVDGKKVVDLQVAAQAKDPAGKLVEGPERKAMVVLAEDGSFVVSYGMALRSGEYTLTVGAVEPKSGKAAAVGLPVKTPDFASSEMTMSSLLVLRDILDVAPGQPSDPLDPLADFSLNRLKLVPHFGNVFSQADTLTFLCAMYGGQADQTTGKPSVKVSFQFMKDGKPVAKAPDQTYDAPNPSHSVGPVPLTNFAPGAYLARITVQDAVAAKTYTQEANFEIR